MGKPAEEEGEDERESIWSIPAKLKAMVLQSYSPFRFVIAAIWLVRMGSLMKAAHGIPDILFYLAVYGPCCRLIGNLCTSDSR